MKAESVVGILYRTMPLLTEARGKVHYKAGNG